MSSEQPTQDFEHNKSNDEVVPQVETILTRPDISVSPEAEANRIADVAKAKQKDAARIQELRSELGILPQDTAKKIEGERQKELKEALVSISREITEFEDELRRNKFNRIPFEADRLKNAMDSGYGAKNITEELQMIGRQFKRDFMPKESGDRMSIEPHNFTRVIDSLGELKGKFVGLRKRLEEAAQTESEPEYQKASVEVATIMNAMRKKQDGLDETLTLLKRMGR